MIPGVLSSATDLVAKAGSPQTQEQLTKLKKACDGMESTFLRQLLTVMRNTVQTNSLGGDNTGEDTYKSMYDNALADRLSEHGTLGISKTLFETMGRRVLNAKVANLK